ncbi:MAG: GNAT family N-acetyltransferase [Pseudomonadota bacterium]
MKTSPNAHLTHCYSAELTMDIRFRPFAESDLIRVRALHIRSFAELAQADHSGEQIAGHLAYIASGDYEGEVKGANLQLAETPDGVLVGTAGWQDAGPGVARIRKVFVAPARARQGLGRRLVAEVEQRAVEAGYERFTVRANINAVPLYAAMGYEETGRGSMDVGNGISLPVVFMQKLHATR